MTLVSLLSPDDTTSSMLLGQHVVPRMIEEHADVEDDGDDDVDDASLSGAVDRMSAARPGAEQQRQMVVTPQRKAGVVVVPSERTVVPRTQQQQHVRYAMRFTPSSIAAAIVTPMRDTRLLRPWCVLQQVLRQRQYRAAAAVRSLQFVAANETAEQHHDNNSHHPPYNSITTARVSTLPAARPADVLVVVVVAHRTTQRPNTAPRQQQSVVPSSSSNDRQWWSTTTSTATTWDLLVPANALASMMMMCCGGQQREREPEGVLLLLQAKEEHRGAVVERSLRDVAATPTILVGTDVLAASSTSTILSNAIVVVVVVVASGRRPAARNGVVTTMTQHGTEDRIEAVNIVVHTGETVDQLVVRAASDVVSVVVDDDDEDDDTTLACTDTSTPRHEALPNDGSMLGAGGAALMCSSPPLVDDRMEELDNSTASTSGGGQALVMPETPHGVVSVDHHVGSAVGSPIVPSSSSSSSSTGQEIVLGTGEGSAAPASLDPVDVLGGQGAAIVLGSSDVVVASTMSSPQAIGDGPRGVGVLPKLPTTECCQALVARDSPREVTIQREANPVADGEVSLVPGCNDAIMVPSEEPAAKWPADTANTAEGAICQDDSVVVRSDSRGVPTVVDVGESVDRESTSLDAAPTRSEVRNHGESSTRGARTSFAALTHRKVAGRRVIQSWNSDSSSSCSDINTRTKEDSVPIEYALLPPQPPTCASGPNSGAVVELGQPQLTPQRDSTWDGEKSRELRALLLETSAALVQSRNPSDEMDFQIADDEEGNVECQIIPSDDSSSVETPSYPWTANQWTAKQGRRVPGYYLVHQTTRHGGGRLKAVFARQRAPRNAVGFWCPPQTEGDDEETMEIIHHSKLLEDTVGCDLDDDKFCAGWSVFLHMAALQGGSAIQFASATVKFAQTPIYVYGCDGVHKTKLDLEQGLVDVSQYQSFHVSREELDLSRATLETEEEVSGKTQADGRSGMIPSGSGHTPPMTTIDDESRQPAETAESNVDQRNVSGDTFACPSSNDIENDISDITSPQNRTGVASTRGLLANADDEPYPDGLLIEETPGLEDVIRADSKLTTLDEELVVMGADGEGAEETTATVGKLLAWLPESKETNRSLPQTDEAVALTGESEAEDASVMEGEVVACAAELEPPEQHPAKVAGVDTKRSRKSVRFGHGSMNVAAWAAEWDQPGYYLVHDNRDGGRLKIKFCDSRVPKHSIGFWCTQDGLQAKSELLLGVLQPTVGCNTDDDKYVDGWNDFVAMAVQEQGSIISFASKWSVPVEVYGFRPTRVAPSLLNIQNGLVDMSRFDYGAVTLVGEGPPLRNPVPKFITVQIPTSDPALVPTSWCAVPFCSQRTTKVDEYDSDSTSEAWDAPTNTTYAYALDNISGMDDDAQEAVYETEDSTVLSDGSEDSLVLYQSLPWWVCGD